MSNFTKKIVAIATALSVTVMVAGPVGAATVEELQALITSLTAQLASLTTQLNALQGGGGGTFAGCTITSFTRNLSQGMSGDDVKCLQIILNSDPVTRLGTQAQGLAGSPGNETIYFGPLTKAAVIKFQAKYAEEVLAQWGLTAGTGYVGPSTRAKLNTMFGTGGTGGTGGTPGMVSVGLANTTPAAGAVATGSQDVVFTMVNFSSGSQAYTVNSIAVTRSGISTNANVSNVKLYDGTTQIGSTQALNSVTNKATFSNLNWIVPANSVKTLTIKASISSSAGVSNSIILGIAALSDVSASVTLSGTFPINGNPMTVASVGVGSLTADMLGTPADSTPISGSVDQHVATLQLQAGAGEGFNVNSIKLTQVGTAGNADVFNVTLKYGATVVATAASLSNSVATFTGSPLINIPAGTSKNLDIYVDLGSGINTSRTVRFEVTQAADIVAVGLNSGGQVTVAAAAAFPEQSTAQTISQGTLVVSLDTATAPTAQTYVIGTTNRVFSAIKFSAGATEGVRVTQITLTLTGTGSASDISNIALYDGNTLIAGPAGISGSTVQFGYNTVNAFDATGLFDIAKSSNKVITVKADISSGATADLTAILSVASAANVKADGLSSQMDVPSTGVTGTATGRTMTIGEKGTLAVALDSTSPGAQTIAKGTENAVLARYSLTAGAGEDIAVSTIIVRLYHAAGTSTANSSGYVTNVSIWDGSTQLGTTYSAPSGSATFNANLTVPAGTKKVITVKGTIPSSSPASSTHANLMAFEQSGDVVSTGVSSLASITESGNALGNLMTIGNPSLAVAGATVPVASTRVANTPDVQMATLLLTAGTAENVTVNTVKVSFGSTTLLVDGSAADTSLSNVRLMDGTTQVGYTMQITSANPDYVQFTGLSLPITAGTTKALAVVVDVLGSSGSFYCGVAAAADITGVGAVSGTAVNSTGSATSTALALTTGGTLAVSVSASTPLASNVAVGYTEGKTGVAFSTFKFTTGIEGVDITQLKITRDEGADSDFGAIYLYDGATLKGTTYLENATATFNFTPGQLRIPAATNKDLTIKADLMGIASGVTHGDQPRLYIAATSSVVSSGASSMSDIVATTTSPHPTATSSVNQMALYRTTASIALAASPDINPGGFMEVMRVNITNNGLYDLTVTSFDVTPTFGPDSTSSASASTTLTWLDTPGTTVAQGLSASTTATKITISPTSNHTVAAGQTRTLIVKADTSGLTTVADWFRMDLAAIADFGWTPSGGSEVTTLTPPGAAILGQTFVY